MNRRRLIIYICSSLLFLCLYFFENNTGTRIVLICALVFPILPAMRAALFGKDRTEGRAVSSEQTVELYSYEETDDEGDIRQYVPGDTLNRIHWKLSAKRDELLVRPRTNGVATEEKRTKRDVQDGDGAHARRRRRQIILYIGIGILSLALLLLVPQAIQSLKTLLNRVFEASEAVNAYVYERFTVPGDQPLWPALLLLFIIAAAVIGITVVTNSRLMAFLLMSCCVGAQVYYGLSLPAWLNITLFALYECWLLKRPWDRIPTVKAFAVIAAVALMICLLWPGVDAGTEQASEEVRDFLSRFALEVSGSAGEAPDADDETRHVHTRSLIYGNEFGQEGKEYRLVTIEEEQISMPHRVNYQKIVLLLLLAIMLLILPFIPFLWLNARRKKALEVRRAFETGDTNTAVCSIFRHIVAWLETTGNGAGNMLFSKWPDFLVSRMSSEYVQHFEGCAALFEKAAYSEHTLSEEQRRQVLELLYETERLMQEKASFRQKLCLKYKECLWL